MKDRISKYAGRVKLNPVTNQPNTYDMERADEPLQEGTPLNKSTLLSDETADLFRMSEEEAIIDKVLKKLSNSAIYDKTLNKLVDIQSGSIDIPYEQVVGGPQLPQGSYTGTSTASASGQTRTVNIGDTTSKCLLINASGFTLVFPWGAFIVSRTYLMNGQNVFIGKSSVYSKFENGVLTINLGDDDWSYLNQNNRVYNYYCL